MHAPNIDPKTGFEHPPERYAAIEAANRESFLMQETPDLVVTQSLHSIGDSREVFGKKNAPAEDVAEVPPRSTRLSRTILAGNMSPLNGYGPSALSPEERVLDAQENLRRFFEQQGIDTDTVRILLPERDYTTPLSVINLDEAPLESDESGLRRPAQRGDFMYTYNSELTLAARPADCPIEFVTAMTPKGEVTVLLHLAWLGVVHDYIDQAKIALDSLEVDWSTVRVQVTPGGHSETFKFTNADRYGDPRETFPEYASLFKEVTANTADDGRTLYDFGIDLPAEVYHRTIASWGIDPYQIFLDTTDTTAPHVGYSSNSRAYQGYVVDGDNTRDIVAARRRT